MGLPYQPYNFLVKTLDDRIIVQNAKGRIQFSGKDASTLIQSAADALTSGRTWCESIQFQGKFTFEKTVELSGYTNIIAFGAEFKLGDNVNKTLFKTKAQNLSHLNFYGGIYDGNKANNDGSLGEANAIKLDKAFDCKIVFCTFRNWLPQVVPGSLMAAVNPTNWGARLKVIGCLFESNNYADLMPYLWSDSDFIGNIFQVKHRGVYIRGSGNIVNGNNFIADPAVTVNAEAIRLYTGATFNVIKGNYIANFTGASAYGIRITHDDADNNLITGNRLRNNNISIGGYLNGNYIYNNPGFNPVGYISPDPTWGASPWTYTNTDGVPEDIYITVATTGDVTSITKGGQNLPVPGTEPTYICRLEPGESIVITYTTAGTLKRFGF